MIILTARGSFADAFLEKYGAEIASSRELSHGEFAQKISQSEVIIHNASTIKPASLETYLQNNFDSTRLIVEKAQLNNAEAHVIVLSSMSILDTSDSKQYASVTTMAPYAYSKYLSETYALKSDLKNVSSVRFSTIFYMDPQKDGLSKLIYDAVINKLVTIHNEGEALRDFIPLQVLIDYIHKITQSKPAGKNIYTISSGIETSYKSVLDILLRHIPDLKITNEYMENVPQVLSRFHTDDIERLGRIPFELEDYIVKYIKKLQK